MKGPVLLLAILLVGCQLMPAADQGVSVLASNGSSPMLSAIGYNGGEFTFTVQGESKATYSILTSSDLSSWTAVATNKGISSTRLITFPSSENQGFVKVERMPRPVFSFGIVANGITISSNFVADSFDSEDPNYSTPLGGYDPSKVKDAGDVAVFSGIIATNGIFSVFGHLFTGSNGTISFGANTSVGNIAWHAGARVGIQPAFFENDLVFDFVDVLRPFTNAPPLASGTISGVNYKYVGADGNFMMDSLTLNAGEQLVVTGKTVLYIKGNLTMNGGASAISVLPTARLELYVGGSDATIGNINNSVAWNFYYYGLPSNTSLTLKSGATMLVAVYAPNADLKMAGGGSSTIHFVGSVVANSVTIGGDYSFHYDEGLRWKGPMR